MAGKKLLGTIFWLATVVGAMAQTPADQPVEMYSEGPAALDGFTDPGLPPGMMPGPGMPYPPGPPGVGMPPGGWGGPGMAPANPQLPESWLNSFWDPRPRHELRIESLFLRTNAAKTAQPVSRNVIINGDGTLSSELVNASAGEQYIAAPRLEYLFHMSDFRSVEFQFHWLPGPNQKNGLVGQTDFPHQLASTVGGPMTSLPANFPLLADDLRSEWNYEHYNADINLMHHWTPMQGPANDLVAGFGFRFFRMQEGYTLVATDIANGTRGELGVSSDNTMYGPQVAARYRMQGPPRWLRLSVDLKIALLANSVTNKTTVHTEPNHELQASDRYDRIQFAPMFESNFLTEFYLRDDLTLVTGFYVMYIDRVDRAANQIVSDIGSFTTGHKELDNLLVFGPRVGLLWSY